MAQKGGLRVTGYLTNNTEEVINNRVGVALTGTRVREERRCSCGGIGGVKRCRKGDGEVALPSREARFYVHKGEGEERGGGRPGSDQRREEEEERSQGGCGAWSMKACTWSVQSLLPP
jgi:hypothetical protein